ncbi:cbb3-type cytochrome oxidase assembly protein CcoS [Carboxylicivirga sediminis]|uniref:Cbb3-type cytochrome oxidase assembly protein CcoS n=1 Tax=Carboxylicivirga sediminis TaxID=2006564 RepID=A0A941F593_9BACT|nr:cbb3-type cytochrome oxidase assembly protein CcoS [Carboxylicivirga sediminis]MBR8535475.1 cbb3-type cytochrome oxidase assembly protein CcoS [Carboxylicivirga sediminis]
MEIIILLVVASLCVALIFLGLFVWAVKSGQYDDDYSPSVRILFDQQEEKKESNSKIQNLSKVGKQAKA